MSEGPAAPYLRRSPLPLSSETLGILCLRHGRPRVLRQAPPPPAAAGAPLVGRRTTAAASRPLIGRDVCQSVWILLPAFGAALTMRYTV